MRPSTPHSPKPFNGLMGTAIAFLLQRPSLRYYRTKRAFSELPQEYAAFLSDVIAPPMARYYNTNLGIFCLSDHTRLLFNAIPELQDKASCLIDNNPILWDSKHLGLSLLPPSRAVSQCDAIFLSSTVHQNALAKQLAHLKFKGTIIRPDAFVPPDWFLSLI